MYKHLRGLFTIAMEDAACLKPWTTRKSFTLLVLLVPYFSGHNNRFWQQSSCSQGSYFSGTLGDGLESTDKDTKQKDIAIHVFKKLYEAGIKFKLKKNFSHNFDKLWCHLTLYLLRETYHCNRELQRVTHSWWIYLVDSCNIVLVEPKRRLSSCNWPNFLNWGILSCAVPPNFAMPCHPLDSPSICSFYEVCETKCIKKTFKIIVPKTSAKIVLQSDLIAELAYEQGMNS